VTARTRKEKLLMGPDHRTPTRESCGRCPNTLGHLDPDFVAVMDETTELLRYVFNTKNKLTIPISVPGSAGMEAALVNSVSPATKAHHLHCGRVRRAHG
jgi:alanine-glyoxylate transaminase/serine-glyoxylate transaminase/serine-pyruvate transaminase